MTGGFGMEIIRAGLAMEIKGIGNGLTSG